MNAQAIDALLDGAWADPPSAVREAEMAEAPARTSTEIDERAPAPKRAAPRAGTVAIIAAAMCAAAVFTSRPGWVSQAEIRSRPAGFADVVDKVKPAVISVRVKIAAGARGKEFSRLSKDSPGARSSSRSRSVLTGQGSGFFISADGYAVTNFHVVEKADNVEVTADDGRVFTAKVIGADQQSDVALIKVDGGNLPFVWFADTNPRVGDWVIAVGNPFGLGGTVTAGIVSARGRDIGAGPYDDFLQIDAPVNRGNSGGPTFDMDGNVIGVNTAIVSPTGGSVGIAFAIPADTVKAVVAQLKARGKVTRGWIGVQIQDVTADLAENLGLTAGRGALVAEPQPGSPAARAGIESGDVIVSVNGKEARDSRELARAISGLPPGTTATLVVVRRGQEKSFNVTLGNLADQREASAYHETRKQKGASVPRLGISVARAADGVIVTSVDPDGAAAELGIASGDIILQAADKKVAAATDLRNAIEAAQKAGRPTVLMRVKSADGIKFIAVPVSGG
jgi:serine protease Do